MIYSARPVPVDEIALMREAYRQEMNCQVVHDSLHTRTGWTQSYILFVDEEPAGYGAVALGGPWTDKPALFEYHVLPAFRIHSFRLFETLLATSAPISIETQTQSQLLTTMIHIYAVNVSSERILFEDGITTHLPAKKGFLLRPEQGPDNGDVFRTDGRRILDWVLEREGAMLGKGGIAYHYNRPYGDIYMETAPEFRKQGIGAYLVQELKRICYAQHSVPAARCDINNVASRMTLQKAGLLPCGHILVGELSF